MTVLPGVWAADLRRLCDGLGLNKPVVLGSSFGGFVALTYAALFPDHPGGIILASTNGGRIDEQRVIEVFRRLGGPEAAAVTQRDFAELTEESSEDDPLCPLPVLEELASQLPADTTRLVRLPGARHTIFRDRPDLAFPATKDFVLQISESQAVG